MFIKRTRILSGNVSLNCYVNVPTALYNCTGLLTYVATVTKGPSDLSAFFIGAIFLSFWKHLVPRNTLKREIYILWLVLSSCSIFISPPPVIFIIFGWGCVCVSFGGVRVSGAFSVTPISSHQSLGGRKGQLVTDLLDCLASFPSEGISEEASARLILR